MITKKFAGTQIRRLSGLAGYDRATENEAAMREIHRVIEQAANNEHLSRAVTMVIDSYTFFPTPAQVLAAITSTRETQERPIGHPHCPDCHSSGFMQVTVHFNGKDVPAVKPCPCRKTTQAARQSPPVGAGAIASTRVDPDILPPADSASTANVVRTGADARGDFRDIVVPAWNWTRRYRIAR